MTSRGYVASIHVRRRPLSWSAHGFLSRTVSSSGIGRVVVEQPAREQAERRAHDRVDPLLLVVGEEDVAEQHQFRLLPHVGLVDGGVVRAEAVAHELDVGRGEQLARR